MPQLSPLTSHFSPPPAALPYNPALSLWLSVDPLSDKYPNLSPYVYCANNPVKYFDPNGKEIWVGAYYYCDGNFYDKEGNIHEASSPFEKKALQSLNTLYGTQQGFELMNPLMGTDEVNVYIKEASDSKWDNLIVSAETGKNIGGTIYWNSNGTELHTTTGWEKNATTDLGHEFSHAFDNLVGYDYIVDEYDGLSTTEWRAVQRENLIRQEIDSPYRTHYKSEMVSEYGYPSIRHKTTTGPEMLKNGKPYFPTQYLRGK